MPSLQEALAPVRSVVRTVLPHDPNAVPMWDGKMPRPPHGRLLIVFNGFFRMGDRVQRHVPGSSCATGANPNPHEKIRDAGLHDKSLLLHWSVEVVNVTQEENGFTRVYVSLEQNDREPGLNVWGEGDYGRLLRYLIGQTWSKGVVHWNLDRPCISLQGKSTSNTGAKIFFK